MAGGLPSIDQMRAELKASQPGGDRLPSIDQMRAELKASGGSPSAPAPAPEPEMGTAERAVRAVGSAVAPVIAPIGRFVDRFTGAPVRSAISAAQHSENPISAYMNQFGEAPENAPTGKEIAQEAGVGNTSLSDVLPSLYAKEGTGWKLRRGGMLDPTASGAAGLGIDVAADPLNLVGVGEVAEAAKPLVRGAGAAAKAGVEGAAKAADFVSGTRAATKTVDAVKSIGSSTAKVAGAAKNTVSDLFKPSLAADAKEMAQVADKNGISRDLMSPAHEFGDHSIITRIQRTVAEGTLGEPYLKAHNAGLEKTTEAFEKQFVDKFGVPPASSAEAGQMIKDAVDKHVSDVFDNAEITYGNASKKLGPISLDDGGLDALRSKAMGMKNEAMRLERTSRDATQLSQAKNLREWSELILSKADKGGSYKELADIVQNVGKAAFTKTPLGQIPSDMKKLRELYNVGSETLIQSIRNHSAAAADELVKNNMDIAEMLGDKSLLGRAISESTLSPEKIYTSLVQNGGSKQIEVLRKILPEETFNAVRSKLLGDIVKYHPDGQVLKFGETLRALQRPQVAEKLSYLFKPEELKDTADLLKFGERYGNPVMSSSGTGASAALRSAKDKLVNAVIDEQTLDTLKSRARNAGSAPAAAPSAVTGAPAPFRRPMLRDRGPMETRLKVAQSASPSNYSRPALPAPNVGTSAPAEERPLKGRDKWANDGLEKLEDHARDPASLSGIDKSDPKVRELLIQASDLRPGSKGMQRILERIKALAAPSKH